MLSIGTILAVSGLVLASYEFIGLVRNARAAKATGLPYTLSPFLEFEKIAYLTTPIIRKIYDRRLLQGRGWPKWARFTIKDWPYEDKFRAHREFGEVFLVAAPHGLICYSADGAMSMDVCTRRKEFTKPRDKYKMLEPFGPNVATAEGDLWRFHNRITAPPFGEANNSLVWTETIRQTRFLVQEWAQSGPKDLTSDIYHMTLNIIAGAGFGEKLDWDDHVVVEGHDLSFLQAMSGVVNYMVHILLLPKWLLRISPWRMAAKAHMEFEGYVRDLITVEKERIRDNGSFKGRSKGNLLTAVLQASNDEAKSDEHLARGEKKTYFSDDEVLGNAFIYLLAGYDTTSNTMMYAAITLACHPDLQDRMIEEIDNAYGDAGTKDLDYKTNWHRFSYTLAFMFEILRVYPIVIHMTKMVLFPTTITHRDNTYTLPASTRVYLSSPGVHSNPKHWPQPQLFSPDRFLSVAPNTHDPTLPASLNPPLVQDSTRIPSSTKGTMLTFSEGARACAGKKFAQVELVGFFVEVLREHRISLRDGIDAEGLQERLGRRCRGGVTLQAKEVVELSLVPRVR